MHFLQYPLELKTEVCSCRKAAESPLAVCILLTHFSREHVQTPTQICTILFCLLEEEEGFPKLS